MLGPSSRARRAAQSLQTQPEELVAASCGLAKTVATLTVSRCWFLSWRRIIRIWASCSARACSSGAAEQEHEHPRGGMRTSI